MKIHFTLLIFVSIFLPQSILSQITTIPAGTATSVNVCRNGTAIFQSATTPPAGSTILWTFPNGNPSSATTIGPHAVTFSTPGPQVVTLTIDGVTVSKTVVVGATLPPLPNLTLAAGYTSLGYGACPITQDTCFYYCGNLNGNYNGPNVLFQWNLAGVPATSTVVISWGDGTFETQQGGGVLTHVYDCTSQTNFTMAISVTAANGNCSTSGIYPITSTIPPQISISGNLSSVCLPNQYTFNVNTNNIPGTTVVANPGLPGGGNAAFNVPVGPLPGGGTGGNVSYTYPTNSCGLTSGTPPNQFQNSYLWSVTGTNVCGSSTTSVGPIYVSNAPQATITKNPASSLACVNSNVTFTNATLSGVLVNSGGCVNNNRWCWSISPSTGWTSTSNFGNCSNPNWLLWPTASNSINVNFNTTGMYYITLNQANGCGTSTVVDSICVVAPIVANFNTDVIAGCAPLTVNTINTPYTSTCTSPSYTWFTALGAGNCETPSGAPTFLNGTSNTSFEPDLTFTAPGSYDLILNAGFNPPLPGTACANTSDQVTINVGAPPTVTFGTNTACINVPFNPNAIISQCYSPSTFLWTVSGGSGVTISGANTANPSITSTTLTSYTITVTITNACGTGTFSTPVTVVPPPTISVSSAITEICLGGTVSPVAVVTNAPNNVAWSISPGFTASFTPNTSLTPTATVTSGTGIATLTGTTTSTACPNVSQSVNVNVIAAPFVPSSELFLCSGETLNFAPTNTPPNLIPPGTQFTWTLVPNGFITGASASAVPQAGFSHTLVNNDIVPQTIVYNVLPINSTGVGCPGVPFTITVHVAPALLFNSPGNLQYCTDVPVDIPLTGFASYFSWNLSNSNTNIGIGTTTGQDSIEFITSITPVIETGVFEVIAHYEDGVHTCQTPPTVFNIDVIPNPVTDPVSNFTFCNNEQTGITFSSSTPGTNFNWYTNGVNVGNGLTGVTLGDFDFLTNNSLTTGNPGNSIITANLEVYGELAGCIGDTISFSITVMPTISVVNPINSQIVCSGNGSTPVNWSTNQAPGVPVQRPWTISNSVLPPVSGGFPPGLAGGGNLPTFSPLTVPAGSPDPGALTLTVTPTVNGCPGNPFTYTINVNPIPILSPLTAQTICGGAAIPQLVTNSTANNTNYTYFLSTTPPSFVSGYPVGPASGLIPTVPVANTGSTPQILNYIITPDVGGCPGPAQTFSLTVNPAPQVTANPSGGQVICSGEGTDPVTLSTSTPGATISWTMVPPPNTDLTGLDSQTSGTTSIPGNPLLINITNPLAPVVVTYVAQATTSGALVCPGTILNYTLTINPKPTVLPFDGMLVCEGDNVGPLNFQGSGNGYYWSGGNNVGFADYNSGPGLNNPTFIAQNATNAPIIETITVVAVYTGSAVACPGDDFTQFDIRVNPMGEITPISDFTVCNNTNMAAIPFVPVNVGGVTSYTWTTSGDLIGGHLTNGNSSPIPGGTVSTGIAPGVREISIIPSFTASNLSCPGPAEIFDITVIPTPVVDPIPNEFYCHGINVPPTPYSGVATSYGWVHTDPTIGIPNISATGNGPGFPGYVSNNPPSSGIPSKTSNVVVTPEYSVNNLTCYGNTTNYAITVVSAASVTPVPNIVVCSGEFINAITFTGLASNFAWAASANWSSIGMPQQSGNGVIPSFGSTTGTSPTVVTITVTPTYSFLGLICSGAQMQFTITVNPTPTLNPISDITICSQVVQPQINFTGTGTGVQWACVNGPIVIATQSSNYPLNGINFSPGFTSINTPVDVFNTFEVTPVYVGSGLTCSGTSSTFTITVLQRPVVTPIADTSICNLQCIPAFPIQGTGNNYTWTINGASNISLTSPGSGGTFGPICGNNSSTLSVNSTITILPQYTMNGVTCQGSNDQFVVTVNPTPNVTPIPNITVCDGSVQPSINITGTTSPTIYNWEISSNTPLFAGITPPIGIGTIPSFTATHTGGNSPVTGQITITPQYTGTGLSCPGAPFVWTVTVNPIPEINPISDQTICFGAPSTPVVFSGTGTGYNWNVNPATIGSGTGQTQVTTFPAFTGINPGVLPLCNTFNVTPVYNNNNVICLGVPTDFEICVLPNPQITQVPAASICNNTSSAAVNYTGTFTSNTLSVANQTGLTNSTAPATGNLPSLTWANSSSTTHLTGVVTATPSYTFNGLTCQGAPMSHNIIVLPTTVVTSTPQNSVYCNGDQVPQIPFTVSGTGVSWTSAPLVGLIPSGTTLFTPAFTASNPDISQGAPAVISTVTITPNYTLPIPAPALTCNGTSSAFTITVNPTPVITEIADYTVCNYGQVNQTLTTNVPSNINWTSTTPNQNFVAGNTTSTVGNPTIFNTLINSTQPFPGFAVPVTYTANAVSAPQGCQAAPMSFEVTLNPDIVMTSDNSHIVCSGNVVNFLFEANLASTFSWFAQNNNNVNGETITPPGTTPILSDLLENLNPINEFVVYNVTPTSINGNCPGIAQNLLVTVTPPPALVSPISAAMCSGSPVNYNFTANTNAIFTYFGVPTVGVSGVNAATVTGNTITDVLVNNTSAPITVSYFVVISADIPGITCSSQPIEIFITVNPLPQMLPITQEICPGGTVNYTLVADQQSGFNWYADNNLNVSGETTALQNTNFIINTLNHSMPVAQNVIYNVTPTSTSTGCVGPTIQHIAIVHPLPDLSYTTSQYLCTENLVTYTISPTTPLNVIWDLGNGVQTTDYEASTFYDQPGNYVVTLYGINPATGCNTISYTPITILLAPPVDFITSSTQECVPAFFQFTNTAQNQGSVLTWNFGDGTTSNEQGVTDHFYQDAGCFDVSLTAVAQNGCPNTVTYEDMVCAYNIPIAGFIVNDPIQYGDVNEYLFENLTVFGHTYFWDLGDGTTTNAVNPGHIYPMERNTYNVTLIATNEAGCSDTTMYTIQVQERLLFYVPNSFTPDGNTRNEVFQPVFTSGYDIYTYELIIFNRWGEPMFESLNDEVGWDGTYGGKVMEAGTYTWRIRFRLLDDDDITEYFGHVNLLR